MQFNIHILLLTQKGLLTDNELGSNILKFSYHVFISFAVSFNLQ